MGCAYGPPGNVEGYSSMVLKWSEVYVQVKCMPQLELSPSISPLLQIFVKPTVKGSISSDSRAGLHKAYQLDMLH